MIAERQVRITKRNPGAFSWQTREWMPGPIVGRITRIDTDRGPDPVLWVEGAPQGISVRDITEAKLVDEADLPRGATLLLDALDVKGIEALRAIAQPPAANPEVLAALKTLVAVDANGVLARPDLVRLTRIAAAGEGGPLILEGSTLRVREEPRAGFIATTVLPPGSANPFPPALEPEGRRERFVTNRIPVYFTTWTEVMREAELKTFMRVLQEAADGGFPGFERDDIRLERLEEGAPPAEYSVVLTEVGETVRDSVLQAPHVAVIELTSHLTVNELIRQALAQWTGRPVGEVRQIEHQDGRLGIESYA